MGFLPLTEKRRVYEQKMNTLAASQTGENGSSHLLGMDCGAGMENTMQSLGSLRICVDRDTAYEQNEVATPRVEPIADWRVQLERERNTGN